MASMLQSVLQFLRDNDFGQVRRVFKIQPPQKKKKKKTNNNP